jgi:hypothetical protein
MMRYKSQASQSKFIGLFLIVFAIVLYFIIKSSFSFVSFVALPISGLIIVISVVLIILSSLQWYKIQDNKILCRQVTQFEVPFKSIKQVSLVNIQSNIRVRYANPKSFGMGVKLGAKVVNASTNTTKDKIEDINKVLNEYNQQTTLAKLKIYNIQTLMISTDKGEFRIIPSNVEEFLVELNSKYAKNTGKKLKIDTSQIVT